MLSATSCLIPVAVVAQPEESFPAGDAFDHDALPLCVSSRSLDMERTITKDIFVKLLSNTNRVMIQDYNFCV